LDRYKIPAFLLNNAAIFFSFCRADEADRDYCFMTGGPEPQLVSQCSIAGGGQTTTAHISTAARNMNLFNRHRGRKFA
jgi:hypothetical protein